MKDMIKQRDVGEVFRDTLRSGGKGPAMVVLPTGHFRMGDLSGDFPFTKHRGQPEQPVRTVTIHHSIAMGKYPVTFKDYKRFVSATNADKPGDNGWGRGMRPVINVSQEDAKAYAGWLSEQTGKRYRLPSEAEWEYAARAGTTTKYSWGDEADRNHAHCLYSLWTDRKTAPVGSFPANPFGLYDMIGNVSEWVEDFWHKNYKGAPTDGSAWITDYDGEAEAVLRGGCYCTVPSAASSAFRKRSTPSERDSTFGFRLAQDITP